MSDLKKKKVLLVDDSESIRSDIAEILNQQGFDYIEANNGRDALELAETEKFDMVITDVNMPEMDGLSLTKKLRQLPQYRFTKILILATEFSNSKAEGRQAGASGWIIKPLETDKLLNAIR